MNWRAGSPGEPWFSTATGNGPLPSGKYMRVFSIAGLPSSPGPPGISQDSSIIFGAGGAGGGEATAGAGADAAVGGGAGGAAQAERSAARSAAGRRRAKVILCRGRVIGESGTSRDRLCHGPRHACGL